MISQLSMGSNWSNYSVSTNWNQRKVKISNNPDSLITITNLDSKMPPKLQLNQNHFDAYNNVQKTKDSKVEDRWEENLKLPFTLSYITLSPHIIINNTFLSHMSLHLLRSQIHPCILSSWCKIFIFFNYSRFLISLLKL